MEYSIEAVGNQLECGSSMLDLTKSDLNVDIGDT